jgi:hypothetical protein
MANNLNVSDNIFTTNGSQYFKTNINHIKEAITFDNPAGLRFKKRNLEDTKIKMNKRLGEDVFSDHQKTTYEIYLKDVEDLINDIDARLLELSGGTRKGRKSRRRRRRRSYKRKSIRRRSRK